MLKIVLVAEGQKTKVILLDQDWNSDQVIGSVPVVEIMCSRVTTHASAELEGRKKCERTIALVVSQNIEIGTEAVQKRNHPGQAIGYAQHVTICSLHATQSVESVELSSQKSLMTRISIRIILEESMVGMTEVRMVQNERSPDRVTGYAQTVKT
jgi:hypothetical protein